MRIHVGTSGFDYGDWRGPFYPRFLRPTDRLAFYAEHFGTVELNVTFYRTPSADAFRGWRDAVPDDFVFAVKASRFLTHVRRLAEPEPSIDYLMDRIGILGDRLGPVLVQLPPSMTVDLDRLDRTLRAFGGRAAVAVEPRHRSWFDPSAGLCEFLRDHDAALVLADRHGPITPIEASARWTYLRLHQGRATPRPCYGDRALRSWLHRLHTLPGVDTAFVYFNNDHRACAVRNAMTFETFAGLRPEY